MTPERKNSTSRPFAATQLASVTLAAVACAALWLPSNAHAYEVTAYADSVIGYSTTPGDVSYSYTYDGGGFGSSALVSFTSDPVASVGYAADAFNPFGQVALNGGGTLTYRFEVEAQAFTNIPIDFSGLYASYQGAAGSLASTSFTIQTVNSSVGTYAYFQSYLYGDCGASNCLQFTTFGDTSFTSTQSDIAHVAGSFDGSFDMLTGADGKVIGQVYLFAGANINIGFGSANATSFIDPHLEIDAAFLAANPGASLTLEAGVGNAVGVVPEPGTLAQMLAGATLLAAVARRRLGRPSD